MTFHPHMRSSVHGVTIVGDLRWRAWPGLIADIWEVECAPDAGGEYVSQAPRLFVLLETDAAATIDLMPSPVAGPRVTLRRESPMCFVPAGMPLWSSMATGGRLKHLDLHLDVEALAARFVDGLDRTVLETPRLTFLDQRLLSLARLIALECAEPSAVNDLYAESLVTALLTLVANVKPAPEKGRGRLTTRHLRRVTDFVEANGARKIALKDLAALVGLSPSYFSEAFKASTGLPPHRWLLAKRIERAQSLLETTGVSLTEAAVASGFADQAHLTRVFRRVVGTTPAAWLRQRRS